MKLIRLSSIASLLCIGLLVVPCANGDEIAPDPNSTASSSVSTPVTDGVDSESAANKVESVAASGDFDFALGRTVNESVLAAARGGAEQIVSENNLDALLEGNSASNLSTGNNSISEGAFSNSTGLPMVIQNSGNNVIIQNSTILNLDLH